MTPVRIWTLLAVIYAAFFSWYTSFGGPLTPEEIEHYMAALEQRAEDPTRLSIWRRFMETDTGDDFAMLNVIEMRETPRPMPGVRPGETSREVLARYSQPFMRDAMSDAAHPVIAGTAAAESLDVWGIEGAEHWSMGALIRYRSRRDLMEQALRAGDKDIHGFKIAAMEKTLAFPLDPWFQAGDPRILLGLVLAVIGLGLHLLLRRRTQP